MPDHHDACRATCSLSPPALQARKAIIAELLERHPHHETAIDGGRRLTFGPTPQLEAQLRHLAELEAECCPTLTLSIDATATEIALTFAGDNDEAQAFVIELFAS